MSFSHVETSTELIEMDKSSINILNLLELVKNSDLVQKISDLKGKVIINEVLNNLSNQFSKFTEPRDQFASINKKLSKMLTTG